MEQDGAGYVELTRDQKATRELLFKYSTEYLAFDSGYQICAFYEKAKVGALREDRDFAPTTEYIDFAPCIVFGIQVFVS